MALDLCSACALQLGCFRERRSGRREISCIRFSVVIAASVCLAGFAAVSQVNFPLVGMALAQPADAEKQAFEAAKELGTVEAWDAFLANYPSGFHADLARAYVKKLAGRRAAAGTARAFPACRDLPPAHELACGKAAKLRRNCRRSRRRSASSINPTRR